MAETEDNAALREGSHLLRSPANERCPSGRTRTLWATSTCRNVLAQERRPQDPRPDQQAHSDPRGSSDGEAAGAADRWTVVAEFGRSLLAKNGFTAACVEYTKTSGGRPIAITHAGAQAAARTVFMPSSWPLRITAHGPDGSLKAGEPVPQDIAGPCCFVGDLLARARPLPMLAPGDIVCLLDTGAYYSSAPFHYNSLPDPAVHGVRIDPQGNIGFLPLRPAETIRDVLARSGG